ncbi:uncharacterized protein F5Z01DRAFT_632723 [Emericellopsis atlantica]|uniref:Uncharacterized protein n=1 Tax=Emericellopsis atlantica TaxID=2614577 RepID=A0A9P7ZVY8_9HYPO|nr:uncharacterized protein F5Z01DRAFT_632723 [Emericellopsis atlantica]KAG9258648.1 hypothetical protein F5Z01DRAFT_632723 [Emericellopsis atlantica]
MSEAYNKLHVSADRDRAPVQANSLGTTCVSPKYYTHRPRPLASSLGQACHSERSVEVYHRWLVIIKLEVACAGPYHYPEGHDNLSDWLAYYRDMFNGVVDGHLGYGSKAWAPGSRGEAAKGVPPKSLIPKKIKREEETALEYGRRGEQPTSLGTSGLNCINGNRILLSVDSEIMMTCRSFFPRRDLMTELKHGGSQREAKHPMQLRPGSITCMHARDAATRPLDGVATLILSSDMFSTTILPDDWVRLSDSRTDNAQADGMEGPSSSWVWDPWAPASASDAMTMNPRSAVCAPAEEALVPIDIIQDEEAPRDRQPTG